MDAEAESIVQMVQYELKQLTPAGEVPRIGILARSRKHLHAIMPALGRAGIAFRAIKILPLNSRPEVLLLRALLRSLLHPADRESWAAILRAPCCGLNTIDLHALMAGDNRPIWQLIADNEVTHKREKVSKSIQFTLPENGTVNLVIYALNRWRLD